MTEKLSDKWQTPQWLFDELNEEFGFDIDLCASKENSKCDTYGVNYLDNLYTGEAFNFPFKSPANLLRSSNCAFMNPPYSNPKPFIEKAWKDSKYCKIVCLVKCDPSTKWWSTFWDYGEYCSSCSGTGLYHGPKLGCEVRYFPKRIKFDPPNGMIIEKQLSGPTFPCALVIFDRRGLYLIEEMYDDI